MVVSYNAKRGYVEGSHVLYYNNEHKHKKNCNFTLLYVYEIFRKLSPVVCYYNTTSLSHRGSCAGSLIYMKILLIIERC